MDDKLFDEIMEDYVDATRLDKEVAFKKLNERSGQAAKVKPAKLSTVWISALVSLIVVLSIAVPTAIMYSSTGIVKESVHYCADSDIAYDYVGDNLSVLNDFGFDIKMPIIECEEIGVLSTISYNYDMVIGMQISLLFDLKELDYIEISAVKKNYIYDRYLGYPKFSDSIQWDGKNVLYFRLQPTSVTQTLRMYFREGDYDYYFDVVAFAEFEIEDILNKIFIG